MKTDVIGTFDLCTGVNHSLNEVSVFFDCDIKYIPERDGDIKHIQQNPLPALNSLNWKAKITLKEGMEDFLSDDSYMREY